jgi:hypothetical protein
VRVVQRGQDLRFATSSVTGVEKTVEKAKAAVLDNPGRTELV